MSGAPPRLKPQFLLALGRSAEALRHPRTRLAFAGVSSHLASAAVRHRCEFGKCPGVLKLWHA